MKKIELILTFFALLQVSYVQSQILQEKQQEFTSLKFGLFIHIGLATYTNEEWASGKEDPMIFNPSKLDCNQWAQIAREANMKYAVLTVKHTSGFSLWPTQYSEYDISAAKKFRNGQGDLVRDFLEAFRKQGIKAGLYYCFPGDYGSEFHGLPREAQDDYVEFIKKQLTELLTKYGDIYLLWCDQYNNKYTGNRWKEIYDHIKKLQPDCLVIANNSTRLGETDIHSYEYRWRLLQGMLPYPLEGNQFPAEMCDIAENAWFWKTNWSIPEELKWKKSRLKFLKSRNCNYLLNVGPDTAGVIHPKTAEFLRSIGAGLDL